MIGKKLHLIAYDNEDFEVISSLLQDAVVPLIEMHYNKIDRHFIIAASRFSLEDSDKGKQTKRVIFGLCFENIDKVKKRNFPLRHKQDVLNLLSINHSSNYISMIFSNDIELQLFGTQIFLRLDDLDKEWPTIFIPKHS